MSMPDSPSEWLPAAPADADAAPGAVAIESPVAETASPFGTDLSALWADPSANPRSSAMPGGAPASFAATSDAWDSAAADAVAIVPGAAAESDRRPRSSFASKWAAAKDEADTKGAKGEPSRPKKTPKALRQNAHDKPMAAAERLAIERKLKQRQYVLGAVGIFVAALIVASLGAVAATTKGGVVGVGRNLVDTIGGNPLSSKTNAPTPLEGPVPGKVEETTTTTPPAGAATPAGVPSGQSAAPAAGAASGGQPGGTGTSAPASTAPPVTIPGSTITAPPPPPPSAAPEVVAFTQNADGLITPADGRVIRTLSVGQRIILRAPTARFAGFNVITSTLQPEGPCGPGMPVCTLRAVKPTTQLKCGAEGGECGVVTVVTADSSIDLMAAVAEAIAKGTPEALKGKAGLGLVFIAVTP